MWTPDRNAFGAIKIGEIQGQPDLGYFRLTVPVIWELAARDESSRATFSDLRARLMVSNPKTGEGRRLARALDERPVVVASLQMDTKLSTDFIFELGRERIEAVERLRDGGDLALRLTVSGTLDIAGREPLPADIEASTKVAQASWLRVLDAMGYGKAILVEVPVLATGVCDELTEAAKRLERAMSALGRGDYRGAVAAAREVVDAIESTPLARAVGELPPKPEEWNKAQRFKAVRRALFRASSPAHHADPHAAAIEWDRNEALAVIAAVAAELMRCCEELR